MKFGNARVVVRVLDPVSTAGLGPDDLDELRAAVRRKIEDARAALQREHGTDSDSGVPPT
jgi:hypothetical protein